MKKIVLYSGNEEIKNAFEMQCKAFDSKLIFIGDKEMNLEVHEVFELDKNGENIHLLADTYALFDDFTKDDFALFFEGFAYIDEVIKINHTENNSHWKLEKLFVETKKEHLLYAKIMQLQELLDYCNQLDYSGISNEKTLEYKDQVLHAFMLLYCKEINEEELDESIRLLQKQILKINNKLM